MDTALVALVALPFVVGTVAMLTGRYADFTFIGDIANNQLLISDVGRYAVLVGPYSRDGWNHFGPLMYYVLAVPYRLFGGRSVGVVVGTLLVGGASVVGTVLLARRLGGRLLMALVAAADFTLMLSLGTSFLRNPWNPYLPVLPFGLFVLACWALADGRRWMLPVVAGVGTFCVQTHVGYVPLVGVLSIVAVLFVGLGLRRHRAELRSWRAPLLVTTGIIVLTWLPPLFDEVARTGNLSEAIRHLTSGGNRGFAVAARIVGDVFTIRPGWITGEHAGNPFTGEPLAAQGSNPVPWLGLSLVVIVVGTWRRETRTARIGVSMVAVAVLASIIGLARTPGFVFDYRLRFVWVIGAYATAIGVWLLLRLVVRTVPSAARLGRPAAVAGALLLVAGGAATTFAQTTPDPPDLRLDRRADSLFRQMITELPRGSGPYEVEGATYAALVYLPAFKLRLEDGGRTVRDAPSRTAELTVGRHRLLHDGRARIITVFLGPESTLPALPDSRRIAGSVQASAAARAAAAAEIRRLERENPVSSRPVSIWRRIERLRERANVLAVFVSN